MNTAAKATPLTEFFRCCENILIVLAFAAIAFISITQIVARMLGFEAFSSGDSVSRYMVLWITLLGAMIAAREDNHINVAVIPTFVSNRTKNILRVFTDSFTAIVCFVLCYASVVFLGDEIDGGAKAFYEVPTWLAEVILPPAFAIIGLRYSSYAYKHFRLILRGENGMSTAERLNEYCGGDKGGNA